MAESVRSSIRPKFLGNVRVGPCSKPAFCDRSFFDNVEESTGIRLPDLPVGVNTYQSSFGASPAMAGPENLCDKATGAAVPHGALRQSRPWPLITAWERW